MPQGVPPAVRFCHYPPFGPHSPGLTCFQNLLPTPFLPHWEFLLPFPVVSDISTLYTLLETVRNSQCLFLPSKMVISLDMASTFQIYKRCFSGSNIMYRYISDSWYWPCWLPMLNTFLLAQCPNFFRCQQYTALLGCPLSLSLLIASLLFIYSCVLEPEFESFPSPFSKSIMISDA